MGKGCSERVLMAQEEHCRPRHRGRQGSPLGTSRIPPDEGSGHEEAASGGPGHTVKSEQAEGVDGGAGEPLCRLRRLVCRR